VKRTPFVASVAIFVFTSAAGRAQGVDGPAVVGVARSRCNDVAWAAGAWFEILRAELAGDRVQVQSSNGTGAAAPRQVTVEPEPCDAAASSATLTFAVGDFRRTRTLTLAEVDPAARARVLAIAVADLVRQSIAALQGAQAPSVVQGLPVGVRIPFDPPRPEAPASRTSVSMTAAAESKLFAGGNAGLFGARLIADFGWGIARVRVDAGVLSGSGHDPLGDVDETVATVGVGVQATGRAAGILLGVGPRVEGGAGWFQAKSSNPLVVASSARSPIALAAVSGVARFAVTRSWSGMLEIDVGTSLYGFTATADGSAGERHVTDLRGPFLAVRLGFGWDWRQQGAR